MTSFRMWILTTALLSSAGCATVTPLPASQLESIRGKTLYAFHREPPLLNKRTMGRSIAATPLALFGILGATLDVLISNAATTAAGDAVVREYKIEDPAILIKHRLAEDLRNLHGFTDVRIVEPAQSKALTQPATFQAVVPEGAIALDIRTRIWAVSYFPAQPNRYRVYYEAKARLLDPWNGKVLASAKAKISEDYEDNDAAPTHEELLANDAALLKEKLERAAHRAAAELSTAIFPTVGEQEMKSFATRYTAAWCSQDPASVAAFFAEQGFLKINDGTPSDGRAAITEAARGFMTDFPDMIVEMNGLEHKGNRYIYRWTLTGTNTGPGGLGNRVRISGYEEWTIGADGLIAASLGHFDAADYQRQLGRQ